MTVHELGLGPGLQIDYAVFRRARGRVDQRRARSTRSRAAAARWPTTTRTKPRSPVSPAQVSSLLFTDFSQLLSLGEQTGLTSGARMRELLPDLAKIRAIGLSSTSGESDTTTELPLEIP